MTTSNDTYQKLILRYETARRLVRDLKKKRQELMADHITDEEDICFINAFNEWADGYSYDGDHQISFLAHVEQMNKSGDLCDNCLESVRIKRKDLLEAKKEFGLAKKAISYAGSKLMKQAQP